MSFWRKINPRGAVEDFAHEWSKPNPYRWRVLGVSLAATFALMMLFLPESQRADPPRPQITWITSFAPDRTDEEIMASNLENQKRKEEIEALYKKREELRKELYRELGRATFLDVDEMEREIARQEAAEKAAAEKAAGSPPSAEDTASSTTQPAAPGE